MVLEKGTHAAKKTLKIMFSNIEIYKPAIIYFIALFSLIIFLILGMALSFALSGSFDRSNGSFFNLSAASMALFILSFALFIILAIPISGFLFDNFKIFADVLENPNSKWQFKLRFREWCFKGLSWYAIILILLILYALLIFIWSYLSAKHSLILAILVVSPFFVIIAALSSYVISISLVRIGVHDDSLFRALSYTLSTFSLGKFANYLLIYITISIILFALYFLFAVASSLCCLLQIIAFALQVFSNIFGYYFPIALLQEYEEEKKQPDSGFK